MILNIDQANYVKDAGETAGIRLVVHSGDRMPFPEDEGTTVSPGHSTSIGLQKVSIIVIIIVVIVVIVIVIVVIIVVVVVVIVIIIVIVIVIVVVDSSSSSSSSSSSLSSSSSSWSVGTILTAHEQLTTMTMLTCSDIFIACLIVTIGVASYGALGHVPSRLPPTV